MMVVVVDDLVDEDEMIRSFPRGKKMKEMDGDEDDARSTIQPQNPIQNFAILKVQSFQGARVLPSEFICVSTKRFQRNAESF
jgi:hypothetical protein